MGLLTMFNNFQNWNGFQGNYDSYLKNMEPASKALQAIANETSNYAKKSSETARSYFEKLSSVKNFDEAIKLQNELASASYQEFMKDSAKFGDLYKDYLKAVFPQTAATEPHKKASKTGVSEAL
jgi:hypothetical protein